MGSILDITPTTIFNDNIIHDDRTSYKKEETAIAIANMKTRKDGLRREVFYDTHSRFGYCERVIKELQEIIDKNKLKTNPYYYKGDIVATTKVWKDDYCHVTEKCVLEAVKYGFRDDGWWNISPNLIDGIDISLKG